MLRLFDNNLWDGKNPLDPDSLVALIRKRCQQLKTSLVQEYSIVVSLACNCH